MSVLLTNDDGIDSPGLEAIYRELSKVADVVVVAPETDHSGVGRTRSDMDADRENAVSLTDHEWGYSVGGTPADCVALGLRGISEADEIDLVVSGCNYGPNVGEYLMGHSGTVGAVVEGAFLGVPGIAVSAYDPTAYYPEDDGFGPAGSVTASLVEAVSESQVFDEKVDMLNVNIPSEPADGVRLTTPVADYETGVRTDGDTEVFDSNYWAARPVGSNKWEPELTDYVGAYPEGSDRRAVVDGAVSITPFEAPQTAVEAPSTLAEFVEQYNSQKPTSEL